MLYFFISDEHFGHKAVIDYNKRPFDSVEEMDATLIDNFNKVVGCNDVTVHAGDFCWSSKREDIYKKYVKKLNGNHIFLKGSHDRWLPDSAKMVWEKTIEKQPVVVCHYAFRVWGRSHYNSWNLYGHSHGRLDPVGKQWDIGVDNNDFHPVSWDQIKIIMKGRPDNFNYVRR